MTSTPQNYPRDLVGYGRSPPHERWPHGARIAVQQHVTSKLFVTFATDVTATQQQAIKVESLA